MKTEIQIVPYGRIRSSLTSSHLKRLGRRTRVATAGTSLPRTHASVFVALSRDLDDGFVELFREKATEDTKLLILHEGASTDALLSRILDLQVRTPQRLCVLDQTGELGDKQRATRILSILHRLASSSEPGGIEGRILQASIQGGNLRVISTGFDRLDVPIARIPALKSEELSHIMEFEIDEDGAFVYWPRLDIHLGWSQLQQLINPEAALKASQKNEKFKQRYGRAVRLLRERAGLKRSDLPGISEKQLARIEGGECRLTSNAIQVLARAHKLTPNDYLNELANALKQIQAKTGAALT